MNSNNSSILDDVEQKLTGFGDLYIDLHRHPELSGREERTAGVVAERLASWGFRVTSRVGGHGVVGVLGNGAGSTVMLRADMDALPVLETTGLDYASTVRAVDDDGNEVPVMHACGHDMHVACLLGAAKLLATDRSSWHGTLVVVFQPAEETGTGAQAMVDDGLFGLIPRPDIILGQHVAPHSAGLLIHRAGPMMAAADTINVTLFGRGGHGSAPHLSVDPVVMAASVISRLQTVVSREVNPAEKAVVTVGAMSAGSRGNIIADTARLTIDVRSFSPEVRNHILGAITRIVHAEAAASGAPRPPELVTVESLPCTVNDEAATARVVAAFSDRFGAQSLLELDQTMGSEDFGILGASAGIPAVFWFFGGGAPGAYERAEEENRLGEDIPSNHSPFFAPVIEPTLTSGVSALIVASLDWLGHGDLDTGR